MWHLSFTTSLCEATSLPFLLQSPPNALRQGRFMQMYHTLYAQSDSVGKKPWGALAAESGLELDDIPTFEACTQLRLTHSTGSVMGWRLRGESARLVLRLFT
jgi:hypothetical protein